MTEKKLKGILQEHPYLVDRVFVRSRTEAARLAQKSSVGIEEFIERSRERSNLPVEAWDVFLQTLAEKRAEEEKAKPSVQPSAPFGPYRNRVFRKAVAVFAVLLLLTAFFTLTETGSTWAEAVYKIVVELFDGGLSALRGRQTDQPTPIDFENIPENVETLEEAAKAIGRPVASIDYKEAKQVNILIVPMPITSVLLQTEYHVNENTLFLLQQFYAPNTVWGANDTLNVKFEVQLQNGDTMYIGYMPDGAVCGYVHTKSHSIFLSSMGMDINELNNIAAKMYFLQ